MQYGVPQGSVLGTLLFLLCTADLDVIITNHGLMSHFYADNSLLYLYCHPVRTEQLRIVTTACIMDRLVDEVEQAVTESCKDIDSVARNTASTSIFQRQSIYPWQHHRQAYHHLKKSAVMMNQDFSMRSHINKLVQSCFYSL